MTTQDLSKMGSARVSVEILDGVECVLKQGASKIELCFYQEVAPKLVGVNSPALLKIEGSNLYIERIANTISLDELRNRSDLYFQLASIHLSKYRPVVPVKTHRWTTIDTHEALGTLGFSGEVASAIERLQSISSQIFEYDTLISGDTNDGNWGTRNNGELVLFDWERFGQGSPAIDLAPLVKGLGRISDYEKIISQYIEHNTAISETKLLEHLIIAKCWIVIEVVNILVRRNNPEKNKYINWFQANIPKWLTSVETAL
ncbi:thiamine kinase activity [Vibrio sp. B1ASS3]|uniref:phosphotransferase family protein n=1 Tax=Vibrio sp. B1ASS3 TaxID=2751176 RepID=UPI001ABB9A90|nr:choline kinase [Vibrio sp. B1ASS3]CAD7806238.1 thiamine kinase activity [Vibrio sp. B1ASS3]CAE6901535.1 thiamine kinase activity [Vibrio sp. B1ASS3]